MSLIREVNFDGIVGPTHHYAGLSFGNVASANNAGSQSNPRAAALQGLEKMRALHALGVEQAVLPPQERPDLATLRRLGFSGREGDVLARVAAQAPALLSACSSASSMWCANAATIAPSSDTDDARVHLTPANLHDRFHRAIEPPTTTRVLRTIFSDTARFVVHDPLPAHAATADEGAANHTRLAANHTASGVHLFVYGRDDADAQAPQPQRFPARHTRAASEAVARLHRLDPARCVFAQQHPAAIDAGVFHHDVIGVGNESLLLLHEDALLDQERVLAELQHAAGDWLQIVEVSRDELSIAEAVSSYLFNSQLVTRPDGQMVLVLPQECSQSDAVCMLLDRILAEHNPVSDLMFVEVRESMRNGGGPACLRLRVPLSIEELGTLHQGVRYTPALGERLSGWVRRHYRDRLSEADLADPALLQESRDALDELSQLLGLGNIYPFQLV